MHRQTFKPLQTQLIRRAAIWFFLCGFIVTICALFIQAKIISNEVHRVTISRLEAVAPAVSLALYQNDIEQANAILDSLCEEPLFHSILLSNKLGQPWITKHNHLQPPPNPFLNWLLPSGQSEVTLNHQEDASQSTASSIHIGEIHTTTNLHYLQAMIIKSGAITLSVVLSLIITFLLLSYFIVDSLFGLPMKSIIKQLHTVSPSQLAPIELNSTSRNDEISLLVDAHNGAVNRVNHYLQVLSDKNHQLKIQSETDSLTGLNNRRALLKHLTIRTDRSTPFAVVFFDIDEFSELNNRYGLQFGDAVLCDVKELLIKTLPKQSFLCRLDADNFVAVFDWNTDRHQLIDLLEHVMLTAPATYSLAIGATLSPADGTNAPTLMHTADIALRHAKEAGGANIKVFSPKYEQQVQHHIALMRSLQHILSDDNFELHYQAKVDMQTGVIIGCEALFRLNDNEMAAPTEVLTEAEQTELYLPLGNAVLQRVFETWGPIQHKLPDHFRISINVSPKQITSIAFIPLLNSLSEKYQLPLNYIDIEIIETSHMHVKGNTIDAISRLRKAGITISLDDFGTGFSSLESLLINGFDQIKIDRQFIIDLPTNPLSKAIINAIHYLSNEFGVTVIAEGVETTQQQDCLIDSGIHLGQGYLFNKPVKFDDFIALLHHQQQTTPVRQ
ncbi:EAL domain-containing protein [Thaumasiovibrio sp. DFM-14]|uniref:EAL domain-containing protein n=1 Tax=Thaumasiovibrio sp. DFM-14 TaxID=3384792 RepID=UPI0039A3181E